MSKRVRGTNDFLPEACQDFKEIGHKLARCFESFGYQAVDLPVLEHTELYFRKGGEERLPFLYDFTYGNRRLCLRPELSASALRLYVENLQHKPKPARLYFGGPVFRYEKPQKGRYRQFSQMGVELIGARGGLADAEVIALASQGIDSLDLTDSEIVLGHAGILARFLKDLDLDLRLQRILLIELDTVRKSGLEALTARLRKVYPEVDASLLADAPAQQKQPAEGISALLSEVDRSQAKAIVLEVLRGMQVDLSGSRNPSEIVERLLMKIERQRHSSSLRRAIRFMGELTDLAGAPEQVLREAFKLASSYGVEEAVFRELKKLLDTLAFFGVSKRVKLDLGLSRGLPFYTGFILEIHHQSDGRGWQLCGGGRYDGLVSALGGQSGTGAAGFSFGIERLRLARQESGAQPGLAPAAADLLVVAVSPEDREYAIRVGGRLRQKGIRVEFDVRGRSVTRNLQYANRQQTPFVAILGSTEREKACLYLKHLDSGKSWLLPVEEVSQALLEQKARHE